MSRFRILSSSFTFIFLVLIFSVSSGSSEAHANGLSEYKGCGLSLEYPADWVLTSFGKSSAGNLSIQSDDACIFLTWTRDPGGEPERIFDQVKRTYSGNEIKIISSTNSRMRMNNGTASIFDIYYAMRNYGARKRFAAWNSSVSDRLFFATLSSSNESYNLSILAFDHMLEKFSDISDRKAARLEQRAAKGDAWAVVLEDLLASFSYRDPSSQLIGETYLETVHSLIPMNETYQLLSMDDIEVDPPKSKAARAAAVQDLLNRNGYETRLIQRGGNIWVAVQDISGSWQLVSINVGAPEKMIGVIIDNEVEGIVYRNISELAEDNLMDFNYGANNSSKVIQKDCEPSKYVELMQPSSENKSWNEDLQKVLDSHNYDQIYRENVFDCSNTSQICWSILQGKGYDARLMRSYKGHPLDSHMWVVVRYPYETERYVAVEATNTDENKNLVHLGTITMNDDHYNGIMYNTSAQFSRLHPDEGIWLEA